MKPKNMWVFIFTYCKKIFEYIEIAYTVMLKDIDTLQVLGFLIAWKHALDIDNSLFQLFLVSSFIELSEFGVHGFSYRAIHRSRGVW